MTPRNNLQWKETREEADVLPFRTGAGLPEALRSILEKANPNPQSAGAFDLVVRSAEAMEHAVKRLHTWKTGTLGYIEKLHSDIAHESEANAQLRAQLLLKERDLSSIEQRAQAAEARAVELEEQVSALKHTLADVENELSTTRKWFSYFEQHIAPVFKNSVRLLEEMGELSAGEEIEALLERRKG